jgi:hypothetical protein
VCIKKYKFRDIDLEQIKKKYFDEGTGIELKCNNFIPFSKILGGSYEQ